MKAERHQYILDYLNKERSITVSEIVENLQVSDMTVRRDLSELEKAGKLRRVHGGAIPLSKIEREELSHKEKKIINIEEKEYIAELAVPLILSNETIFLGPGTTIEVLAEKIVEDSSLYVTNCLPVFLTLNKRNLNTLLIGGEMRQITESFHGDLTTTVLKKLKFDKAFFSCNGIIDNEAMTSTFAEGHVQSMALNNARARYLLVDSNKIGQEDFYAYYDLRDLTAIITNDDLAHSYVKLEKFTKVVV